MSCIRSHRGHLPYLDEVSAIMMEENVLRDLRESLISHGRVWHMGTLQREEKGWESHEGDGLSVSLDPDIWRRLARLSGSLYQLEKEQAAFLDAYHCFSLPPLMRAVWKWGLREQYVERRKVYRVDWYDFEEENWRRFSFLSGPEARAEYRSLRLTTPQDVRYNTFVGYVPTNKMRLRAHHRALPLAFVRDFALSFYAQDHLPEIDGLWWEEQHDPNAFSAPRGVIFTHQLSSWKCFACPRDVTLPRCAQMAWPSDGHPMTSVADDQTAKIGCALDAGLPTL